MSEILSYREPCELFIRDGRFSHRGGRYRGKGWLRWNPETGARIDITAERTGPPLPKRIGFGYAGWLKSEHYTTIRMRTEGFHWVIAPRVGLVDRPDIVVKSCLSVEVKRLIWRDEWERDRRPGFSGHVTLAFRERTRLFTPVEQITTVGTRQVLRTHSAGAGLLAESDGVELCGHLDDLHRARLKWSAPKANWSKERAWAFGYALRAALSLCAQCRAPVLERELLRTGHRYRELQPYEEPSRLGYLGWFGSFVGITAEDCLRLALAFNNNDQLLTMAWGVFSQLLDAQDQRAWGSSELLVAITLEGILRTLDNEPFSTRKKYNPQEPMKRLRRSSFPSVQAKQADRALAAHRRLRNRNAHPDWLEPDRRLTRELLSESSEDMAYLSRLYGRIIFEVAGLPEVAARIHLD